MTNRRFPRYPDDNDYTTNSPSYYDDLARKQRLIKLLAERIWEYEKTLDESLEHLEQRLTDYILQNDTLMTERLENWDKRIDEMPEEMRSLFVAWLNDGTLEQIINHDVLGNKADKTYVDGLNENINTQLAQTTDEFATKNFYNGVFNRKQQKGLFTWVDDDGNIGFKNRYKEIMEEFGVRFTSAIIGTRLGTTPFFMSEADVKEMIDFGCEIVSHGYDYDSDNRLLPKTTEEYEQDVRLAWEFTKNIGGNPNHYVIPFGESTPTMRNILAKYHIAAYDTTRHISGGTYNTVDDIDNMWIHRVTVSAPIEHIKQQMLEAKENNGWIIIMSHVNSDNADDNKVREILQYREQIGLDYGNLEEGFNRFGNVAQVSPTDVISASGEFKGKFSDNVVFKTLLEDVPINAPIDFFEREKVTYFDVNSPTAQQYGLPTTGTIKTVRTFRDTYSHQVYQRRRSSQQLIRFWYVEDGWGEWLEYSPFTIKTTRTLNTTISANSVANIRTDGNYSADTVVHVQPPKDIQQNVLWSAYVDEDSGEYIIRIFNLSDKEIVLVDSKWTVAIISN